MANWKLLARSVSRMNTEFATNKACISEEKDCFCAWKLTVRISNWLAIELQECTTTATFRGVCHILSVVQPTLVILENVDSIDAPCGKECKDKEGDKQQFRTQSKILTKTELMSAMHASTRNLVLRKCSKPYWWPTCLRRTNLDVVLERLQALGYATGACKMKASDFHLPQRRNRYYIFGVHHPGQNHPCFAEPAQDIVAKIIERIGFMRSSKLTSTIVGCLGCHAVRVYIHGHWVFVVKRLTGYRSPVMYFVPHAAGGVSARWWSSTDPRWTWPTSQEEFGWESH